ncbi:hypothetical protein JCM8547_003707 [Rhodosporidiobolus lusitaniae]
MSSSKGYARLPALPLPAALHPSAATSRGCRPPRRAVVLLAVGLAVLLWVVANPGKTEEGAGGLGRADDGREGFIRGGEVRAGEGGEEGVGQLVKVPAANEEVKKTTTGTQAQQQGIAGNSSSSSFSFSTRLPCNALTTSIRHLASPHPFDNRTSQTWLSPSPPLPPTSSLSSRLEAWLSSPLAPPSDWTAFNLQTCGNPSVRRNRNKVQFEGSKETWEGMDEERVGEIRRELVEMLRAREREGAMDEWRKKGKKGTRGLVWTAGNADTFDRVLTALRLLRHSYSSTLPAMVYHFPSESPSPAQLDEFASLSASVLPLSSLSKDAEAGRTKSFHLKGAALVEAPFDEVLMLDSDNVPVRDLSGLWDSPEFMTMGAVLWPDYFKDQPENAIWSILGVQCRDEFTTEAGQLLIRKSEHLDVLLLVEHMLKDWQFWFKFSDGDKDLFRYALLALRKRWAVPSLPLSPASWLNKNALGKDHTEQFAGHTMLQYGLASEKGGERGRAMFVHGNLLKRVLSDFGKTPGDTWGRTLRLRLPTTSAPFLHSPSSSESSASSSSSSQFILTADDLANVSPFTGLGIPSSSSSSPLPFPPLWAREHALLARSLLMHFFDGHKGAAYVLAVETSFEDELKALALPQSGEDEERKPWEKEGMVEEEWEKWREWVEAEREAKCTVEAGVEVPARGVEWTVAELGQEGENGRKKVDLSSSFSSRKDSLRHILLSVPFSSTPPPLPPSHADDSDSPSPIPPPPEQVDWLEIALWQDDPDLEGFEKRYYEIGKGVPSGRGFR